MVKCVLSIPLISRLFFGVRGILQLAQRDTQQGNISYPNIPVLHSILKKSCFLTMKLSTLNEYLPEYLMINFKTK
jgi:hypothetical protein